MPSPIDTDEQLEARWQAYLQELPMLSEHETQCIVARCEFKCAIVEAQLDAAKRAYENAKAILKG